ncbi:MAG TPA: class IV adenylate cyclase [Bryobacteraceae bacterium]
MLRGNQETEIKLAVPDVLAARRLLRKAGFRVSRRRVFEANTVFDTAERTLRQANLLLRVRETRGADTFTFKGAPLAAKHKTREELEVTLSSAATCGLILQRLGYQRAFRYEKYRTEFRLPGVSGVATLDETPIGVYMELEGSPRWIDWTARRMGFREQDYITASYGRLYLEWCTARKAEPGHMVFR